MALNFVVKHFKRVGIVPYSDYRKDQRSVRNKLRVGKVKAGIIRFSRRVYSGTQKVAKAYNSGKGKKARGVFENVYNNLMNDK
jgi:hypothetical protein